MPAINPSRVPRGTGAEQPAHEQSLHPLRGGPRISTRILPTKRQELTPGGAHARIGAVSRSPTTITTPAKCAGRAEAPNHREEAPHAPLLRSTWNTRSRTRGSATTRCLLKRSQAEPSGRWSKTKAAAHRRGSTPGMTSRRVPRGTRHRTRRMAKLLHDPRARARALPTFHVELARHRARALVHATRSRSTWNKQRAPHACETANAAMNWEPEKRRTTWLHPFDGPRPRSTWNT